MARRCVYTNSSLSWLYADAIRKLWDLMWLETQGANSRSRNTLGQGFTDFFIFFITYTLQEDLVMSINWIIFECTILYTHNGDLSQKLFFTGGFS